MRRTLGLIAAVTLVACTAPTDSEFVRPATIRLSDGSEAVDRGTAEATGGRVTVTMGEFFFDPTVIRAPRGTALTIELVNAGRNVHNFEAGEIDLTLAEGAREVATIEVPDQGGIVFACKFHLPRAMRGEIRSR